MAPANQHYSTVLLVYTSNFWPNFLNGEDISGLEPHILFEKGVLRTFQLAHEFKSLTVRENLMVVLDNQAGESLTKVCLSNLGRTR